MVDKYNSTYHRSIKLTPSDARNPSNYQHVYNALYGDVRKSTSPKFHVGDKVRIARKKGTFEKGYTPNWTKELFTISSVKATNPPTYTNYQGSAWRTSSRELLRARAAAECTGTLPN